jgi:hypothetical protein
MLTTSVVSIAFLIMLNLSEKERLVLILLIISCSLTSLSFYLEILRRSKSNNR